MLFNPKERNFTSFKIKNYTKNGLIIDACILSIMYVGEYDLKNNTAFLNKLSSSKEEFNFLINFLKLNTPTRKKFIVTPQILTEFCSLTKRLPSKNLLKFRKMFKNYLIKNLEENRKNLHKEKILSHPSFYFHGVGDVSLFITTNNLVKEGRKVSIITTDEQTAKYYENEKKVLSFHWDEIYAFNTLNK